MVGVEYLYLFYGDYVAEHGNPQGIINATKDRIKENAKQRFSQAGQSSAAIEQVFEQKYKIEPDDFGALDITPSSEYGAANAMMMSFDAAISALKTLIKDGGTVAQAQKLGQEAIYAIDQLLEQGAKTGGLADGAYNQLQQGLKTLKDAHHMISYVPKGAGRQWAAKDEILRMLADVESNVSGYAFELACVYGVIGSSQYALKEIHETMINIGSNSIGENVTRTFKEDPQILADLEKLTAALSENASQSKADAVINMHMQDGQGSVTGTATWVGFQQKNYKDVSSIHLATKTLGELGFFNWYDTNVALNVAGALGSNYRTATKINWDRRRSHKDSANTTQGEIDQIWNGMKNSMKLLLAADAIAGEMNANFTNKVNYYVVRSKALGQVRVIGVSRILNRIAQAFSSSQNSTLGNSALGINWDEMKSGKNSHRERYWSHSVANFYWSGIPEAKYIRSSKARPKIWAEIMATKVSISLNFSSFFQ